MRRFDVERGTADVVLREVARQSGAFILFPFDRVRKFEANGIHGDLTVAEALDQALAGTPLSASVTDKGVITVSLQTGLRASEGTEGMKMGHKRVLLGGVAAFVMTDMLGIAAAQDAADASYEDGAGDQILVRGIRNTIVNSIAEKRDSNQIIDTLSSDLADNFPDANVAEALARLPGVSFRPDQSTGVGEFISVRGLSSTYNLVMFDGVSAGTTSRNDRRVNLSSASADNVSETRISKALLPAQDGEGIGGQVDIITRSALDTGKDRFNASIEGRYSEFADPNLGWSAKGGFTKLFGEDLGVNFSAAYERRFIRNIQINGDLVDIFNDIPELDLGDLENTVGVVPVEAVRLEDVEYLSDDQVRNTLSLSGSVSWNAAPSTRFDLIGRFNRRTSQSVESSYDIDSDLDFDPAGSAFDDPEMRARPELEDFTTRSLSILLRGRTELDRLHLDYYGSYAEGFESAPDFELMFRAQFDDDQPFAPFLYQGKNDRFPVPMLDAQQVANFNDPAASRFYDSNIDHIDDQLDRRWGGGANAKYDVSDSGFLRSVQIGVKFETKDILTRQYKITNTGDYITADGMYDPTGNSGDFTVGDIAILAGGDHISLAPMGDPLGAAGYAVLGIPRPNGSLYRTFRDNVRASFEDALAAGAGYEAINYRQVNEDTYAAYLQTEFAPAEDWSIIAGVRYERQTGDFLSNFNLDPTLEVTAGDDGEDSFSLLANDGLLVTDIAGAVALLEPGHRKQSHWLPRIVSSYRPGDNWVLRAAYTTAITRPNFDQLATSAGGAELVLELSPAALASLPADATADDIAALALTSADVDNFEAVIEIGNPNLKDTYAHQFDLSAEYYFNGNSAITVGVFYKRLSNFVFDDSANAITGVSEQSPAEIISGLDLSPAALSIFEGLGGLDALIANGDIEVAQPVNGRKADIYGVEVGLTHQFTWAPGLLRNFGTFANFSYIESSAEVLVATLTEDDYLVATGDAAAGDPYIRKTDFFEQPSLIANAALFYQADGYEVTLSYFRQSDQLLSLGQYGYDGFQKGFGRLDLTAEYTLPWSNDTATVFFKVSDLTDGGAKPTLHDVYGPGEQFNDRIIFNGREFRFGLKARF